MPARQDLTKLPSARGQYRPGLPYQVNATFFPHILSDSEQIWHFQDSFTEII